MTSLGMLCVTGCVAGLHYGPSIFSWWSTRDGYEPFPHRLRSLPTPSLSLPLHFSPPSPSFFCGTSGLCELTMFLNAQLAHYQLQRVTVALHSLQLIVRRRQITQNLATLDDVVPVMSIPNTKPIETSFIHGRAEMKNMHIGGLCKRHLDSELEETPQNNCSR